MEKEKDDEKTCKDMMWGKGHHWHQHNHSGNAVYGLGFIGAAIFFIGKATTFGAGVVGLLKAIVWPAYLAYHALNFLIK